MSKRFVLMVSLILFPFLLPTVYAGEQKPIVAATDESKNVREVFFSGEVNSASLESFAKELLRLDRIKPGEPIRVYINSGGGYNYDGVGMVDVMKGLRSPVETICVGKCMSMAAFILAGGTQGMRSAYPHARIMLHQTKSGASSGNSRDLEIAANELRFLQQEYIRLMAEYTKKPSQEIEAALKEETYLSAEEALRLGLIDKIIGRKN